ncbi:hypothetical protein [Halorussus halophilus]|uniref:hypothetical protein n=1 Tax=Halorussus halophilus TaxID=2650975 RepID=UPI001787B2DB|nr:hypothetical protein [Halorussus halophilus]
MSSIGESFEAADNILTLLAVIPFCLGIAVASNNIGNPNFDMTGYTTEMLTGLVHSLVPDIGAIVFLGVAIYLFVNLRN